MGDAEEIHILVIFSCETGAVEQLALAAAVGAVQARASIRLRRLVDPAGSHDADTERMDRDYVAPRDSDMAWADGLVLGVPDSFLPKIQALGDFAGKPVVSLVETELRWDVLSDRKIGRVNQEDARMFGRQLAETVRADKESTQ